MIRHRLTAALVLVAIVVSGCGAEGSPDASSGATVAPSMAPAATDAALGACALLDLEAADDLLGGPLVAEADSAELCQLSTPGATGALVLQITPADGALAYDYEIDLMGSDEEVPGVGDRAFRSANILAWQQGDRFIALAVVPEDRAQEVSTAELVALAWPVVNALRD